MAAPISKRLFLDKENNMFMPMNLEGEGWNENFMTTGKYICIFGLLGAGIALGYFLSEAKSAWQAYAVGYLAFALLAQLLLRRIVFEEKFYHRMYKKLMLHEISTPATFWGVASAKDTEDGAILTYLDGRIAVLVRLERDTITGKPPDFKETHYEAYADFYKEIVSKGYCFIQMNIMEQAGRDPRLAELSKLTTKNDNKNICILMERQVGYIKNITHRTLYESDYVLIHTKDTTKVDQIIGDAIDCTLKILDGAFINYGILSMGEVVEFIKEEYGVKYFDFNEATLEMLKNQGIENAKPFEICGIEDSNQKLHELTKREYGRALRVAGQIISRRIDPANTDILDQIIELEKRTEFSGIDFDNLGSGLAGTVKRPEPARSRVVNRTRPTGRTSGNTPDEVPRKRPYRGPENNEVTMEMENSVYDDSGGDYSSIGIDEFEDSAFMKFANSTGGQIQQNNGNTTRNDVVADDSDEVIDF